MPAAPTQPKTFRYEVETESGQRYELELDREIPENDAGRKLLEELLYEQLSEQQTGVPIPPLPFAEVGRGIVGGTRDFAQQFVDLPSSILNAVFSFINPQPPGPGRLPPPIQIEGPRLPEIVGEPKSSLERTIRKWTPLGMDVAALLLPIGKGIAARRAAKRTPMMFEKGSVRRDMAIPRGKRTDLEAFSLLHHSRVF